MTAHLERDALYTLLGVTRDATSDEIRKAYRRRAIRFFPDRTKPNDEENQMRQVAAAYEVLSDPWSRRRYDTTGKFSSSSLSGSVDDMFDADDMFSAFFGTSTPAASSCTSGRNMTASPADPFAGLFSFIPRTGGGLGLTSRKKRIRCFDDLPLDKVSKRVQVD